MTLKTIFVCSCIGLAVFFCSALFVTPQQVIDLASRPSQDCISERDVGASHLMVLTQCTSEPEVDSMIAHEPGHLTHF